MGKKLASLVVRHKPVCLLLRQKILESNKKDMEYGLCLGLNVTALRFFKGFDSPQEFGVNTVFEMGHENMDPMLYDKLG